MRLSRFSNKKWENRERKLVIWNVVQGLKNDGKQEGEPKKRKRERKFQIIW